MGRPATVLKNLDAGLRKEIDEAIRSAANERPIEIYRRFGLAQRGVKERSFYIYVDRIRAAMKTKCQMDLQASVAGMEESRIEQHQRLLNLSAATMSDCLLSGDYEGAALIGKSMTAQVTVLKLSIEEAANERAQAKFIAWQAEQDAKRKAAFDAASKDARLTPDQVKEIRLKVLGL